MELIAKVVKIVNVNLIMKEICVKNVNLVLHKIISDLAQINNVLNVVNISGCCALLLSFIFSS